MGPGAEPRAAAPGTGLRAVPPAACSSAGIWEPWTSLPRCYRRCGCTFSVWVWPAQPPVCQAPPTFWLHPQPPGSHPLPFRLGDPAHLLPTGPRPPLATPSPGLQYLGCPPSPSSLNWLAPWRPCSSQCWLQHFSPRFPRRPLTPGPRVLAPPQVCRRLQGPNGLWVTATDGKPGCGPDISPTLASALRVMPYVGPWTPHRGLFVLPAASALPLLLLDRCALSGCALGSAEGDAGYGPV